MSSPRLRAAVALTVAALCGPLAACGSSSSSSTPAHPSVTSSPSMSSSSSASSSSAAPPASAAGHLQAALLANKTVPKPTSASCRTATAADRAAAPFGPTKDSEFVCLLAASGGRDTYHVQVLPNGCYVAERARPGKAIYGCGMRPSS